MPIRKKFALITIVFAVISFALTGLSYFAMETLSTTRAYVGGEGSWSKGQKNAIYALARYATEGKRAFYQEFRTNMAVPLADHEARVELEKSGSDLHKATDHFINGEIHPTDAWAMAVFYKRFRTVSYIAQAISIWVAADEDLLRLAAIGESLHQEILGKSLTREEAKAALAEIDRINARLTGYENRFSQTLGEAARWLNGVLVTSMLSLSGLFLALGVWLSYLISRSMVRNVDLLTEGTRQIRDGHLGHKIPVETTDEMGVLASCFNEMASSLDKKTKDLIQSSKLASLGEMAGGVAHEINSPLTVIQLAANQIKELAEDKSLEPMSVVKSAERIERMVERIAKIIKSMRTVARDGKQDPFEEYNLSQIVQETMELCGSRVKEHGIELKVTMADKAMPVQCRRVEISQVLLNIMNNAVDAVQSRADRWIEISTHTKYDSYEIRIQDSGTGIPADIRDKIMQPFFTTKEVGKGTGLGLSISRSILDGHGGTLDLDATVANTCFIIRLPRQQVQLSAA